MAFRGVQISKRVLKVLVGSSGLHFGCGGGPFCVASQCSHHISSHLRSYINKEDGVKMERALGLLLCPLPWKALPDVFACVQQPAPVLKLRNLLHGAPWYIDITDVEAENVFMEVKCVQTLKSAYNAIGSLLDVGVSQTYQKPLCDPAQQLWMLVMPHLIADAVWVVQVSFLEMYSFLLVYCRVRTRSFSVFCSSFFYFTLVEHIHDTILRN